MKKIRGLFKISLLILIIFASLLSVSAHEDNATELAADTLDETPVIDTVSSVDDNQILNEPDAPDYGINITSDNVDKYFKRGTLQERYSYYTFSINEDFDDLGILTIKAKNVVINGNNHTLKNTFFSIEADGVTLNNLTLVESKALEDNEYAAVLIYKSVNVNLYNLNIDYKVPDSMDGYAIYSLGSKGVKNNSNLKIVNCVINFEANNLNGGRDYAVRLEYSPNAIFRYNKVNAALSLRDVGFVGTTANLNSESSLGIGISECDDLQFVGNAVNVTVICPSQANFPTLDAIFICDSKRCVFSDNDLYLSDFITCKEHNYLYGLDGYRVDDMLIEWNYMHVETTGGEYAAGAAYPIQLTGPAEGIIIRYNDLYSISDGPNIGIYSQNFNGDSYITILNNHINVTGWAGDHNWALVTGIEVQDNKDIIMNNIIEVHNSHEVSDTDNLYGISYAQGTPGNHSYKVVNNTVFSNGRYLSHMLTATNTTVTNNTFVRLDYYADTNYDPFKRGNTIGSETDSIKNNYFSGNRVMTLFEYLLQQQSNDVDGGTVFYYETPTNTGGFSNIVDGSRINPARPGFPGGNPLIPGNSNVNLDSGQESSFGVPDVPDGDPSFFDVPDLDDDDGKSLSVKKGGFSADTVNSFNNQGTSSNSFNNRVWKANSSSSSPSLDGVASSGSSSKSASGESSAGSDGAGGSLDDSSRSYEITKKIVEDGPGSLIRFIGFAIVCEILLIVGYRRKEKEGY